MNGCRVDELAGSALAQMRERLAVHALQIFVAGRSALCCSSDAVLMERAGQSADNAIKHNARRHDDHRGSERG